MRHEGANLQNEMAHLQKALKPILFLLFTSAAGYVLARWFFPIRDILLYDEVIFLPERLWFKSRLDWLTHVLFFAQNRIVYCGDFMLIRPLFLLWIGIQDIIFRTDRVAQNYFLIFITGVSFAGFFSVTYKRAGKFLAAAAFIYAFTCLRGMILYTWPHINGYLVSITLYVLAGSLLVSPKINGVRATLVGVCFFVAENFMEFVPVAIATLIGFELLLWRTKREKRQSNLRLAAMVGSLAAYGAVVLLGYLVFRPPGIFAPSETDKFSFGPELFDRLYNGIMQLAFSILDEFTPFPMNPGPVFYIRCAFGAVLIGAILWATVRKLRAEETRKILICHAAVLTMLGGLFFGRLLTRGTIGIHYYAMIQYFLVMAAILAIPVSWKAWPRILIGCVLLASSVRSAYYVGERNERDKAGAARGIRAIEEIMEFLDQHHDRCFSGLSGPGYFSEVGNTILQEQSCGWRPGAPAYFEIGPDGAAKEYLPQPELEPWKSVHLLDKLPAPLPSPAVAEFLKGQPYNIREAQQNLRHDGNISLRLLGAPIEAKELTAKFRTADSFPELYNVGIAIVNGGSGLFFILLNNVLTVQSMAGNGQLTSLGSVQVNEMKREFALRITETANACQIFYDQFLIIQIGKCLSGQNYVGTFSLPNGTPEETLVDFSFKP